MFTWIKRLFVVAFVVGILYAGSYAGARFQAGKFLGTESPMGGRTAKFEFKGAQDLPGTPRVWVFTYATSRIPGVRQATIYVSLSGNVVATKPENLEDILEAWEKSLEP